MSMAPITGITPYSPIASHPVEVGDKLLSINGKTIIDVLDYKFYSYDATLCLRFQKKGDTCECGTCDRRDSVEKQATNQIFEYEVTLSKEEGEDVGLEFATYLMDNARSCANRCIFCFVDQMPKGMRSSLYFKDDDARLSFLTGNYITLTNLSPREITRIIDVRISPINISVHSTNPSLREEMLKHPKAGECMTVMKQLAQGNITMNCQIVACPQVNDGEELWRSLEDLASLYPQVNSISVVPVGLTRFRDHLPPLQSYHQSTASALIDVVEEFAEKHKEQKGTSLVWCSDEFYLQSNRPLPEEDYYEEFTQLDNGVGMLRMFRCEFQRGLGLMAEEEWNTTDCTIATGTAAAPLLMELLELARNKSKEAGYPWNGVVRPIKNDFFGHSVNVAGLVTGQDLIAQLQGNVKGNRLLIPESMLRHGEDVFLDDVTIQQVEDSLNVTLIPVPQDGYDLVDAIFGVFEPAPRTRTPIPMTTEAYPYNPK